MAIHMYNNLIAIILSVCAICLCSCHRFSNEIDKKNELVMHDGMTITAINKNGSISIHAKKLLSREISWNNHEIKTELMPREKRWYGSLGAYSPGGGLGVHAVVEEGQQHFSSKSEVLDWLLWRNELFDYVYTSDGLVVGWYTQQDKKSDQIALGLKIWQIYIDGRKPSELKGSSNNLIEISYDNKITSLSSELSTTSFVPSKAVTINGRMYSGKSIDYLNDPAVHATTDLVEKTILTGNKNSYGSNSNLTIHLLVEDELFWVLLDKDGSVILVGR